MNTLEIVIVIFILIISIYSAIRIAIWMARKKQQTDGQLEAIVGDIKSHIESAVYSVSSAEDVAKLKKNKNKILSKLLEIIKEISDYTYAETQPSDIVDRILGEVVQVNLIPIKSIRQDDVKCITDYQIVENNIRRLISDNIFPGKKEFSELNKIYKKYKRLVSKRRLEQIL